MTSYVCNMRRREGNNLNPFLHIPTYLGTRYSRIQYLLGKKANSPREKGRSRLIEKTRTAEERVAFSQISATRKVDGGGGDGRMDDGLMFCADVCATAECCDANQEPLGCLPQFLRTLMVGTYAATGALVRTQVPRLPAIYPLQTDLARTCRVAYRGQGGMAVWRDSLSFSTGYRCAALRSVTRSPRQC